MATYHQVCDCFSGAETVMDTTLAMTSNGAAPREVAKEVEAPVPDMEVL